MPVTWLNLPRKQNWPHLLLIASKKFHAAALVDRICFSLITKSCRDTVCGRPRWSERR